jgi:hypothetical protein
MASISCDLIIITNDCRSGPRSFVVVSCDNPPISVNTIVAPSDAAVIPPKYFITHVVVDATVFIDIFSVHFFWVCCFFVVAQKKEVFNYCYFSNIEKKPKIS